MHTQTKDLKDLVSTYLDLVNECNLEIDRFQDKLILFSGDLTKESKDYLIVEIEKKQALKKAYLKFVADLMHLQVD